MGKVVILDATPLSASSGTRGIGRYIHDLLYGLDEIRDEWQDDLDLMAFGSFDGPPSRELGEVATSTIKHRGTAGAALVKRRSRELGRMAKESGASLVHITEAMGTPLRLPVPRLVTCYDLIPLRYPKQYLGSKSAAVPRYVRDTIRYRLADRIVAISEKTRDEVVEILHISRDLIDVAPTGVDASHWSAPDADGTDEAKRHALSVGHKPYVIYVGFLDHRKNLQGMLMALSHARREIDIELVWAGRLAPSNLTEIAKWADFLGVRAHVRLLGFVADEDLRALYRGAVANVFLSRLEGFGLPVAEAMATGCPVIVGRGSGTEEIAGDAGFVVDPDDPIGAGEAILQLFRDPAEAKRRIALGQQIVARSDRKRMARTYVDSYRKVLGLTPREGSRR